MPRKRKAASDEALPSNGSSGDGADATGELSPKRRRKQKSGLTAESKKQKARKPTDEEIRVRAYFIAEMRQRMSIPGDPHSDWIEARRQLLEELGG